MKGATMFAQQSHVTAARLLAALALALAIVLVIAGSAVQPARADAGQWMRSQPSWWGNSNAWNGSMWHQRRHMHGNRPRPDIVISDPGLVIINPGFVNPGFVAPGFVVTRPVPVFVNPAFVVHQPVFGSPGFVVRQAPFVVQQPPFVVQQSPFVVQQTPFVVQQPAFVAQQPGFVGQSVVIVRPGFGHPGFDHPGFDHPGFDHPGFGPRKMVFNDQRGGRMDHGQMGSGQTGSGQMDWANRRLPNQPPGKGVRIIVAP